MIPAYPDFIKLMTNYEQKEFYIKLELYDKDMKYLFDLPPKKILKNDIANIRVDRNSPIQRSFSFSLDNSDSSYSWGSNNDIWINKRVKVYVGLKLNGEVRYIPQGVFIVTAPFDTHNKSDGKKCNITGMDKAYLFTDKRGKIVDNLEIASGTNIATAIKTIATQGGETLFNFDTTSVVTPYKLTYEPGNNRWDIISELSQFGKMYAYYDVNGYLRLKYIGDLNDFYNLPDTWTYEYLGQNGHMYGGNIRKMDETILYNAIRVLGGSGQTASVYYDLIVDDTVSPFIGSPYSYQQLGYLWYGHNNWNPDPLIGADLDAAKYRAKYELMNRLGYSERVSLSISMNFLHEAGDIIRIIDSESGINDRYMIDSFNLPLTPGMMNVECRKEVRVVSDWNSF
jgi:hypothetical protein